MPLLRVPGSPDRVIHTVAAAAQSSAVATLIATNLLVRRMEAAAALPLILSHEPSCGREVLSRGVAIARHVDDFCVVLTGLRGVSHFLGGVSGADRRAKTVRLFTHGAFERGQCLRRHAAFEQHGPVELACRGERSRRHDGFFGLCLRHRRKGASLPTHPPAFPGH